MSKFTLFNWNRSEGSNGSILVILSVLICCKTLIKTGYAKASALQPHVNYFLAPSALALFSQIFQFEAHRNPLRWKSTTRKQLVIYGIILYTVTLNTTYTLDNLKTNLFNFSYQAWPVSRTISYTTRCCSTMSPHQRF